MGGRGLCFCPEHPKTSQWDPFDPASAVRTYTHSSSFPTSFLTAMNSLLSRNDIHLLDTEPITGNWLRGTRARHIFARSSGKPGIRAQYASDSPMGIKPWEYFALVGALSCMPAQSCACD
ncbi:Os02g0505066 [Oryza sativa Japonica Group]|uniref:Os02g0505066 protein n=1 Tax=Oryza sativa subsp. japonica TaxID=39947 RepID=A0A0P0VJD2_ORYSJ|nr:hypothetical protein EE612_011570 [Oryza sativa]BAS78823.1 Os02g0505066 [Oryza sativa Japonica Group]